MGTAADRAYFSRQCRHRLMVEVLKDSGNRNNDADWVDLNARAATGQPDYYAGLRNNPSITMQQESDPDVYAAAADTLVMDNRPWNGQKYGFWDARLPVTLTRAGVNYTFSSWRRRLIRLRVETRFPNGTSTTNSLGLFRIKEPITNQDQCQLVLLGLQEQITKKSAINIRDGGSWYRSWTIAALIRRLALAADPEMSIGSGLSTGAINMGTLDDPLVSSWGGAPGTLTTGNPSSYRWIPRCHDFDAITNRLWVGFEVPGSNAISGAGIAYMDVTSGLWTIIATPDNFPIPGWPVWIQYFTGYSYPVRWLLTQEENESADPYYFYGLYPGKCNADGGSFGQSARIASWWPARFCMRQGNIGFYETPPTYVRIWGWGGSELHSASENKYYGENLAVPFPQCHDHVDRTYQYEDPFGIVIDYFEGFALGRNEHDGPNYSETTQFAVYAKPGAYSRNHGYITGDPPYTTGFLRFFFADYWHQPQYKKLSTTGTPEYLYWIGHTTANYLDANWRVHRLKMTSTAWESSISYMNLELGDVTGLADVNAKNITAYAISPGLTGTQAKMTIATLDWDEAIDTTMRRSGIRLLEVDLTGTYGGIVTPTLLWSYTPSTASRFTTIVGLWTAKTGSALTTGTTMIASVFDRWNMASPCYGVGLWTNSGLVGWMQLYGFSPAIARAAYTGPTSSMPFSGFTYNLNDSKWYFTDQATGQLWSLYWDSGADTVTYTLENDASPMHQTEHLCAATQGIYTKGTDDVVRQFWALAPAMRGDVTNRLPKWVSNWSSYQFAQSGIYPLVMHSTKLSDVVEVAVFSELTAWEGILQLKQLCQNHRLVISRTGALDLQEVSQGTSIGRLRLVGIRGSADVEAGDIPILSYSKTRGYDDIRNAIDVVPWVVQPAGEPTADGTRGAGSQFGGEIRFDVTSSRQIRLSLSCVCGGDAGDLVDSGSTRRALLFSYRPILESVFCYLAVGCSSIATTLYVGAIRQEGGKFYSGEQEIRVGDQIRVGDGPYRTISYIRANDSQAGIGGAVEMQISGGTILRAAPAYAEVEIAPQDGSTGSDYPITTLAASCDGAVTTLTVADGSRLRKDQIILIDDEMLRISTVSGNTVTVAARGAYNTNNVAHTAGASIYAWVGIHQANVMYEVGDTGIRVGVYVDSTAAPSERTVVPGDGIVITSQGEIPSAQEHATIRAMDSKSVTDNERSELPIKENRFVDLVKAKLIAAAALDRWANERVNIVDAEMQYWPTVQAGSTVSCSEPPIIPFDENGAEQVVYFEAKRLRLDTQNWMQRVSFRALSDVTGAGKRDLVPDVEPDRAGYVRPRGRRGHR